MQDDINKSLVILKDGGVILYPTDTIWGIGCDATNRSAIERIYEIKRRDESRSMLVLVNSVEMLYTYVGKVTDTALQLIDRSENPLTVIYPSARNFPPNLTAEDGTIGIRIVNDPFCRTLIQALGCPIVSTSANISGAPAPVYYDHITDEIRDKVDYIVFWRRDDRCPASASSIIKLETDGSYHRIR